MDADAMLELIRTRRSHRAFTDRRPEPARIEQVIEAACWAPSNHNRQGWKFLVFCRPEVIRALAGKVREEVQTAVAESGRMVAEQADEIVHYAGLFENAPVVILAMHKRSVAVGRQLLNRAGSSLISGEALSTAMAVQNLCPAAHALGMGTCVMTAPLLAFQAWSKLPDLPAGFEPTCLVALGYPAERPEAPRRKELRHVIEYR